MSKKYYIAVEDDSKGAGLFLPMNVETEIEDLAEWVGVSVGVLKRLIKEKKPYNGMLFEMTSRAAA